MHGPHDSDDFMIERDRKMLYTTPWKIGHNSNRTGVRLVGPVPEWSRKDGGEGGSHPSNIFDYGYPCPGGINWGGDSPVIFSMDSPDLGGLLCSSTVISADLWRVGQVKPGGHLKLNPTTFERALELTERVETFIKSVQALVDGDSEIAPSLDMTLPNSGLEEWKSNAILEMIPGNEERHQVVYRQVCVASPLKHPHYLICGRGVTTSFSLRSGNKLSTSALLPVSDFWYKNYKK